MIKIFNASDRDFTTAGNIIINPTKCIETRKKSLNGWFIDVEIPIKYKQYIEQDKLCVAKTKSKLKPQAFRIKDPEIGQRRIKFKAYHVMFDAEDYFLNDVRPTNLNGNNAINYINERTDKTSPFTVYSDVESFNTAYFIRKNLLEAWTTMEERWGGVFDADNWNIYFMTNIGKDNGETIIYGQNMQGINIIEDWSSVCTRLYPVGYDELTLPEEFLESDVQYDEPYTRTLTFETKLESEEQTEENLIEELRKNAEDYLETNKVPKISYTLSANINEKLEIGDTVHIKHPFCNITTEVLEYEYNITSEKMKTITFGNYSKDVKSKFNNIKDNINKINEKISTQEKIINNQTNLINSLNKNGYVYIDDNEILILDKIPKEKAKNVWRFGLAGLGFSSNGYEGPFETAITIDGQINAKFITTGTLQVSRIEGLTSELEGIKNSIQLNGKNIKTLVEQQTKDKTELQEAIGATQNEFNNFVNETYEKQMNAMQAQIDGQIQSYFYDYEPTLTNSPANEWTTEDDKIKHMGDLFYNSQNGLAYRFSYIDSEWVWVELQDTDVGKALANAQNALNVANNKRRVFVVQPTPPYDLRRSLDYRY